MTSSNDLSFLPDDYLKRKAQRRSNVVCASLFLVVMVAIGTAFHFTQASMAGLELQHSAVVKQYAEAAKRIEQVKLLQQRQRTMAEQAELSQSLLEKAPRSYLLAQITNSMPAGVSLLDLQMTSKRKAAPVAPQTQFQKHGKSLKDKDATPPPQPQTYDVHLELTGVAGTDVQVAQFMGKLLQCRLLQDVNLAYSQEFKQNNQMLRKFEIEMMLNPDAEATQDKSGEAAQGKVNEGVSSATPSSLRPSVAPSL
jgi:Tfp pilus assembly protein PilN